MTKINNNNNNNKHVDVFFWLGADGELEEVTKEEFDYRQESWKGPRPSDNNKDD